MFPPTRFRSSACRCSMALLSAASWVHASIRFGNSFSLSRSGYRHSTALLSAADNSTALGFHSGRISPTARSRSPACRGFPDLRLTTVLRPASPHIHTSAISPTARCRCSFRMGFSALERGASLAPACRSPGRLRFRTGHLTSCFPHQRPPPLLPTSQFCCLCIHQARPHAACSAYPRIRILTPPSTLPGSARRQSLPACTATASSAGFQAPDAPLLKAIGLRLSAAG